MSLSWVSFYFPELSEYKELTVLEDTIHSPLLIYLTNYLEICVKNADKAGLINDNMIFKNSGLIDIFQKNSPEMETLRIFLIIFYNPPS